MTYHKTINATCVEKKLADKFGGWDLDLPKPIEELEVSMYIHSRSEKRKHETT